MSECDSCEPLSNPGYSSLGWIVAYVIVGGVIYWMLRPKEAYASTPANPPLPPAQQRATPTTPVECVFSADKLDAWGKLTGIQVIIVTDNQGHSTVVGAPGYHVPKLYWQQNDAEAVLRTQDRQVDQIGSKSYCAWQRAQPLAGVPDPTALFLL